MARYKILTARLQDIGQCESPIYRLPARFIFIICLTRNENLDGRFTNKQGRQICWYHVPKAKRFSDYNFERPPPLIKSPFLVTN